MDVRPIKRLRLGLPSMAIVAVVAFAATGSNARAQPGARVAAPAEKDLEAAAAKVREGNSTTHSA